MITEHSGGQGRRSVTGFRKTKQDTQKLGSKVDGPQTHGYRETVKQGCPVPLLNTRFSGVKHYHAERTQSRGCHRLSSAPSHVPLILPTPNSENSPTTHRSKGMLSLMVGHLQGLPGKMGYLSSPSSHPSPLPSFLCSMSPGPLLHAFHLLTCLPGLQWFDTCSASLLSPGPPTFQPFHLPATSRVTSPTVCLSHMMPHLIPLCQLLGFPCGGGVEEDEEDRVGHGSNPAETLCS